MQLWGIFLSPILITSPTRYNMFSVALSSVWLAWLLVKCSGIHFIHKISNKVTVQVDNKDISCPSPIILHIYRYPPPQQLCQSKSKERVSVPVEKEKRESRIEREKERRSRRRTMSSKDLAIHVSIGALSTFIVSWWVSGYFAYKFIRSGNSNSELYVAGNSIVNNTALAWFVFIPG